MSQGPPQEDAIAAGASVRGAPSNPVAAETLTAAAAQEILKVRLNCICTNITIADRF